MSAQAQLAQALALLYLAIGEATDGVLTPEESHTLAERVHLRAPGLSTPEIELALRRVYEHYHAMPSHHDRLEAARAQVAALRHYLDLDTRRAIMADLVEIAKADGYVSDEELDFIDETSVALGL